MIKDNKGSVPEVELTDKDVLLIIQKIDSSKAFKTLQMKQGKIYSLVKKV